MRALRRQIAPERRAAADHAIQGRAAQWLTAQWLTAQGLTAQRHPTVALYRAFDGEVSTDALRAKLEADGARIVDPIFHRGRALSFVQATGWTTTSYGLPVPTGIPIEIASIDAFVVPGVAFDRQGHRLGMGGGAYDRTLPLSEAPALALAYAQQIIPSVPIGPWDHPMDAVITEVEVVQSAPPSQRDV